MRDPELEALKEASQTILTLNRRNGLDLFITFDPDQGILVLEERMNGDELVRLSGGTTLQLFNKLLEEFPAIIKRHEWR